MTRIVRIGFLTTAICLLATACGVPLSKGAISQEPGTETQTTSYSFPATCDEHRTRTLETFLTTASLLQTEEQIGYIPGHQAQERTADELLAFRTNNPELYEQTLRIQNLARTQDIVCRGDNGGHDIDNDFWIIENIGANYGNVSATGQSFLAKRVGILCEVTGMILMRRQVPQDLTWEGIGMPADVAAVCNSLAPIQNLSA